MEPMETQVNKEIEAYLNTIFTVVPPLPENKELYFKILGKAQKEYEGLVSSGTDALLATEQVMEKIPEYPEIQQIIPLEEGKLWTKAEVREREKKRSRVRAVAVSLFIAGFVVLLAGLLIFRQISPVLWVLITIILWILPVVLLLMQRAVYQEEGVYQKGQDMDAFSENNQKK